MLKIHFFFNKKDTIFLGAKDDSNCEIYVWKRLKPPTRRLLGSMVC